MITSKQRAYLRGLANDLPAIMQVGKAGITDPLVKTCSDALEARELIKLHILESCNAQPRETANALAQRLQADVVAVTGKKVTFYRRSTGRPVILLPEGK